MLRIVMGKDNDFIEPHGTLSFRGDFLVFREAVRKAQKHRKAYVLLNMRYCSRVSELGWLEIQRAHFEFTKEGGALKMVNLSGEVRRSDKPDVLRDIEVYDSVKDARESIGTKR
jgi:hypothetical protein